MEHRRMVVRGRVQGVWYRKHTREKALELGLRGWVMNQPDGSVLVEAEESVGAGRFGSLVPARSAKGPRGRVGDGPGTGERIPGLRCPPVNACSWPRP